MLRIYPAPISAFVLFLSSIYGCSGTESLSSPPGDLGGDGSVGGSDSTGGASQAGTTGGSTAVGGGLGTGGGPGVGGLAATGGANVAGGTTSATGGTKATGGSPATGGANTVGGTTSANGGTKATGGNAATGGSNATGGSLATGGSKTSGGAPATGGAATGGTKSTGGMPATGGTPATGGARATGGTPATGGAKATGGTPATGGAKATGGTPATGGASSTTSKCSSVGGGTCPARGSLTCPFGGGTDASTNAQCGCYIVNGLGANKKAILDAGASQSAADQQYVQYMLASAMMETALSDANYTLGDGKTGDSFNAGVAKQNLGMIKVCHPAITTTTQAAQMNSNRALDVQVYVECRKYYGSSWWAGHRNGTSGLSNPNTTDIQNFKAGEDWTNQMIQNGSHQCDNVRFWVTMPAIIIR